MNNFVKVSHHYLTSGCLFIANAMWTHALASQGIASNQLLPKTKQKKESFVSSEGQRIFSYHSFLALFLARAGC